MAQMWLGRGLGHGSDAARTRLGHGSAWLGCGSDVARTRLGRGSEAARSGSGTARAWFGRDLEIIWTIFCPKLKRSKQKVFWSQTVS